MGRKREREREREGEGEGERERERGRGRERERERERGRERERERGREREGEREREREREGGRERGSLDHFTSLRTKDRIWEAVREQVVKNNELPAALVYPPPPKRRKELTVCRVLLHSFGVVQAHRTSSNLLAGERVKEDKQNRDRATCSRRSLTHQEASVMALWESKHLGPQSVGDSSHSGTAVSLGQQALWDSRQSGTAVRLGQQAVWDNRHSGTEVSLGQQSVWDSSLARAKKEKKRGKLHVATD